MNIQLIEFILMKISMIVVFKDLFWLIDLVEKYSFPRSAHEDGNAYKFSYYFYSMTLKSGIKVQRFWLCYSVG